ncbi:glycerate kinase, partial [Actinomadura montaniterrae]
SAADVRALERGLARLDEAARRDLGAYAADRPGAGAAGGTGFGAMAFLGATVRPGIAHLLDLLGFPARVAGARLVITGEGSLDRQSLRGKAPVGVARAAARHGVPAIAVAGRCALTGEQLRKARLQDAYALADLEPDPERCMAEAGPLLERLAERIGRDWPALGGAA